VTRFAIGLGSNLGDRLDHLTRAVAAIAALADSVQVSPLYETIPIGGPEQGHFLNSVVVIETGLDAGALLEALQDIESEHGRVRAAHWGPRTLDTDIIASDGPEVSDQRLVVPHPRAAEREFVLRPLTDVWPDAPVGDGMTAREALRRVEGQGVALVDHEWWSS
jgi:2-amino-4-hydroxy-6-hydroxymethyldihydropteridine diphosphokinase